MHIDQIKEYYQKRFSTAQKEHYEILGWESYAQQHARFEALIREVDLRGKKILDVGCGLGDLWLHLRDAGIEADYTGVDILEFMIERARRENPGVQFYYGDIFRDALLQGEVFDVVYASGIFNLDLGNNGEFFERAVRRFFELSRHTIAFSLLHDRSPDKEAPYFYYRPSQVVECVDRMPLRVRRIDIIEDYAENDFTAIIEKMD